MLGFVLKLSFGDIARSRFRLLVMAFTVIAALTAYVGLGATLDEMGWRAKTALKAEWPFDVTVRGQGVAGKVDAIRNIRGVADIEEAILVDVIAQIGETRVLVPDPDSFCIRLDFDEGTAPASDSEIAVPAEMARYFSLAPGGAVRVLVSGRQGEPVEFTVSGILADKIGVPRMLIATKGGAVRLGSDGTPNALLLTLDGQVSMASVQSALAQIERRWDITAYDEQYESVARASSPADLTAAAIRSCVLVVSVASVASLLNLSQKERAYQSGVLRAMGMGKGWLLVPPVIEGLLTSVVGVLGARLVLERTHSYLGLTRAALVRGFLSDSAWFVGIGFGVVVFTTLTFAFRPVTSLLRDTWGKT